MKRGYPNLFLIAGNGRKSGKTALACRLIRQFSHLPLTAIKVSSHFHEPSPGMLAVSAAEGYSIWEETNPATGKDTSRMLQCGAERVYYVELRYGSPAEPFSEIMSMFPDSYSFICESPSLINHVEPGVFVIMINEKDCSPKDISEIRKAKHYEMTMEQLALTDTLPFSFSGGRWIKL